MKNKNDFKGVWIPLEIMQRTDLNYDEKVVLAIIHYYTVEGNSHACFLTNQDIADLTALKYYHVRDDVKPSLRKKGLIDTVGLKSVSTLYSVKNDTKTTPLYSAGNYTPESNNSNGVVPGTMRYSVKNDGGIVSGTMGGIVSGTIQNKEEKKEINKEEKKTYNISTFIGDARGQAFTHVKSDPGDAYTPTIECLIDQYEDDGDDLPLLQYLDDHPDETVYERIAEAMEGNDEQLQGLKRYWNGIQNGITATRYTDDRPKAVQEGDCSWLTD